MNFCLFLLAFVTASSGGIESLPRQVTLQHLSDTADVVVVRTSGDNTAGPMVDDVVWTSSDPAVAIVRGDRVVAKSAGRATLTATDGSGATTRTTVTVRDEDYRWTFRNDVQNILARQGCNMGACHGTLAGKGGFKLSLRGYDCDADFESITRQARGRRIEMSDPGRSLLLAKPTGAIPHKGGLRLDTDSRDYEILAQWIAAGAAGPAEDDARLETIRVTPDRSLLSPGDQTRILVHGVYDNGEVRDVTHWSQFTATDQSVAGVDQNGLVSVTGPGQGAVLVWFGSKVALARFMVPFDNEVAPSVYADAPRRNFIDDLNLDQLQRLRLEPSPRCDDESFLRRACLDTVGRLPTEAERSGYFQNLPDQRRDWLVDRLLSTSDYVDYWTYRWSDVLLINGNRLRPAAVKSYYDWLHDAVAANMPWDELAKEVLTSTGDSFDNGATNFFALNQTPEDMTENACQAFMGLSIGCAKCHNHPLEKWTNDQYYAMANMFARVRAKGWGGDTRQGNGRRQLYVSTMGDLIQPNTGRPQPPAPLDAPAMSPDDPTDRRQVLADWMTSPDNIYFSRSITNRVWSNFFGQGLVEQVDDLRLSNPASNEPLLAAAAKHLIDNDYDLKSLMRTILQSETYGRSSVPLATNRDENKFLSRYYPRRLMAEVLLDSIDQVLGTSTAFTEVTFSGADKQGTDFYHVGTRAIELYDSAVDSYFLKTFGRNPREITCECERDDEPSMVQALHLSNGQTLNPKLESPESLPSRWGRDEVTAGAAIDELFVRALSRMPTDRERDRLIELVSQDADRTTALRDATWSVLTSTEFTFNH